jgi:hypothetical protein
MTTAGIIYPQAATTIFPRQCNDMKKLAERINVTIYTCPTYAPEFGIRVNCMYITLSGFNIAFDCFL